METLRNRVSNYTAPYMVILDWVNALLPTASTLTVMHATGLVLHFMLVAAILYVLPRTGQTIDPAVMVALVMLMPTSVVNATIWGQVDAFFACFLILCYFAATRERWLLAFVAFGTALSIKLVAILVAPAFLIALARAGKIKLMVYLLPITVVVYLVLNAPYLIAGVPIMDVLWIYGDQAATYDKLSMNAPNIWFILSSNPATSETVNGMKEILNPASALVASVVALGMVWLALRHGLKRLENFDLLWLITISGIIFPSILTKMHDRYFFMADVCAWCLALMRPQFIFPAMLIQFGSLAAYARFLEFSHPYLPVSPDYSVSLGAGAMGLALMVLIVMGRDTGTISRVFGAQR